MLFYSLHRRPLLTTKMVFHSRFEVIFQSEPLCLPFGVFAFLFATQRRMNKYTCEFRAGNKTCERETFFFSFRLRQSVFFSLSLSSSIFAFNERTGSMPIVPEHYTNTAQTHNESERFKLRSHDYNYKYLRFRYQWIILFYHYFQERTRKKKNRRNRVKFYGEKLNREKELCGPIQFNSINWMTEKTNCVHSLAFDESSAIFFNTVWWENFDNERKSSKNQ